MILRGESKHIKALEKESCDKRVKLISKKMSVVASS